MVLKEWPDFSFETFSKRSHAMEDAPPATMDDSTLRPDRKWTVHLKLAAFKYEGNLIAQTHNQSFSFPWARDGKGHAQITSLETYPLAHAGASRKQELVNRGVMFWDCRFVRHIQYSGLDVTRLHHFVSCF